jgi:hypothetical protein
LDYINHPEQLKKCVLFIIFLYQQRAYFAEKTFCMVKTCLSCKKKLTHKIDPDDDTTFFCDRDCFDLYEANLTFENLNDNKKYIDRLNELGVEDV